MIEIKRIVSGDDPLLDSLKELYTEAFPPEERRSVDLLGNVVEENEELFFSAVLDGDELVGLVGYWVFPEFMYLEHLAVFTEMRNRKIGQQVLDFLAESFETRILEVEPVCDEITERRVNYYQRNGYKILDKGYIQPAYSGLPEENLPLWIMGAGAIDAGKLQEYISTIKAKVYNYFE
ncbi:GNAT family N-acetyltransferase [Bacteroidales bacterium OttesenSCG-928-A17]|nr:GNAT family N-acetyltransferase [Bacteroidales bacterium OttesenSCG-928-A17]